MNIQNSPHRSRIGIFGGTFNPPHIGHLIVAEEVRENFALDRIVFIPSARPPHKTHSPVIDPIHRFQMIQLATRENPYFEVSNIEIRRPGTSYTIDTVKSFRNTYGPDGEIFFIMGGDSIFEIDTWKDREEIFKHCTIIVTSRPGFHLSRVEDPLKAKILLSEVSSIGISSTGIRQRIQEGKSIRYLVPRDVETYIREQELYRSH